MTDPETTSEGALPDTQRFQEKLRVLERHNDHLMGQLYHQVHVIRELRDQVGHLTRQHREIMETPKLLDESLKRISQLKEDLAGRKEVELDLRRRVEELEREELAKLKHIGRLEGYLHRIWYSPHRRFLRTMKHGFMRVLGKDSSPKELSDDHE